MKKICLLKQGLAVMLSLSLGLGPCAPGSFAAFADTTMVSSEVETDTGEVETGTEEGTDSQGDEAPEGDSSGEEASGDSVSAVDSAGEEASDDNEGEALEDNVSDQEGEESDAGETNGDGEDAVSEDNDNDGAGDEAGAEDSTSAGEESNGQDNVSDGEQVTGDDVPVGSDDSGDKAGSEAGSDNEEEISAADKKGESAAPEEGSSEEDPAGAEGETAATEEDPGNTGEENDASKAEEADAASETVADEAETEAEVETETEAAPEDAEIELEGEVTTETRHILQAEVDETTISLIYDDGVFPEDVTLEIRKVDEDSAEQEEIREKVEKAFKEKNPAETEEEESAKETENENEETAEAEASGVWLSAFEIRVLDENGEECEPDTEKGEVFVRFEGISVPDGEDTVFGIDDITVFGLKTTADDRVRKLETVEDPEGKDLFMTAEGVVVDDIGEDKTESEKKDTFVEEAGQISVAVKAGSLGMMALVVNTGVETLLRQKALETDEPYIYWGIVGGNKLVISADPVEGASDGGKFRGNEMYYADSQPWAEYRSEISTITVGDKEKKIAPSKTTYWFNDCEKTESIDLSGLDTSNVTDMAGMFLGCSSLTSLDVSGFNTAKVRSFSGMFEGCSSLTSLDVRSFDTSEALSMASMFRDCESLEALDVSGFDTGNVFGDGLMDMFGCCRSLRSLDVSGFNTEYATDITLMFYDCEKLESLDLSSFSTGKCSGMADMFLGCRALEKIYVGSEWDTSKVTSDDWMFGGAASLQGGKGTRYDGVHTNKEYARIDKGEELPGYFTSIEDLRPFDKISFAEKTYTLFTGDILQLKILYNSDELMGKPVIWSSADTTVAEMDQQGNLTALSAGRTVITAKLQGENDKATCEIVVRNRPDPENVIASGTCGDHLTWSVAGEKGSYTLYIQGTGNMYDYSGTVPWLDYEEDLTAVYFQEGITRIGAFAFAAEYHNNKNLSGKLKIPSSVKSIGSCAFADCRRLTGELEIPDGVEIIEVSAFRGCQGFTGDLKIPDSVKEIQGFAFENCSGLDGGLELPSALEQIGDYVFDGCVSLSGQLIIPDSVHNIGTYSFRNCCSFTGNPVLPQAAVNIGLGAFQGCRGLSGELKLPESLEELGKNAFFGCSGLTGDLRIPDKIKMIPAGAFEKCTGLNGKITFPDTLETIDSYAFAACINISDIEFPESLQSIGDYAFLCCRGLNCELLLPEKVHVIGEEAFNGCGLHGKLMLPGTAVKIGDLAFGEYYHDGMITVGVHGLFTEYFSSETNCHFDVIILRSAPPECNQVSFYKKVIFYPAEETAWTEESKNQFGPDSTWIPYAKGTEPWNQGIPVTEVSIDQESITLKEGERYKLQLIIKPDMADDKDIVWVSSDVTVASVSQTGEVTALKAGTAVITAEAKYSGKSAACTVTVKAKDLRASFIDRLYLTCMNRAADEGGRNFWLDLINNGSLKGIGLAGSFVFSKEFTSKNYCNEHFVRQLYPALMGREADAGGLAFWVGKLESGVTREAMVNSFTSSNEYKSLCSDAGIELGPQLKDTDFGAKKGIGTKPYGPCAVCGAETKVVQFAERMYTECMKRPADTGGLAYWSKGLYEQTITGKSILNSFFLSSEMKNMGLANQEYVRRIYKTMLDRDPDTGGLNYWTGRLDNGASPTVVINGFIDSKEFSKICEDYGIQRK